MGRCLVVEVDNQGSVGVYRKGHRHGCPYITTLVRAAYVVSQGMAVDLRVHKIRRCSDKGSILADAVSKGDLATLRQQWPERRLVELPDSIVAWVKDPVEDMELGHKVLRDLAGSGLAVVMLDAD